MITLVIEQCLSLLALLSLHSATLQVGFILGLFPHGYNMAATVPDRIKMYLGDFPFCLLLLNLFLPQTLNRVCLVYKVSTGGE